MFLPLVQVSVNPRNPGVAALEVAEKYEISRKRIRIVEVKAAKAIADEHLAQILDYLRPAKMEPGVLVNFGSAKFQIRKLGMCKAREG